MIGLKTVVLKNVEINARNHQAPPIAIIPHMEIEFRVGELLGQHLRRITIDQPQVNLSWNRLHLIRERFNPQEATTAAQKRFQLSNEQAKDLGRHFQIDTVEIRRGHLVFRQKSARYAAQNFTVAVNNLTPRSIGSLALSTALRLGEKPAGDLRYRCDRMDLSKKTFENLDLNVHGLDLNVVASAVEPHLPERFRGGRLGGQFDLRILSEGPAQGAEIQWALQGLRAETRDGSVSLKNIVARSTAHAKPWSEKSPLSFEGEMAVSRGALMYETFYQGFTGLGLQARGELKIDPTDQSLILSPLNVHLPAIGDLALAFELKKPRDPVHEFRLRGRTRRFDLAALKSHSRVLGLLWPELDEAKDLSGLLSIDADVQFAAGKWNLNGDVDLRSGSIHGSPHGWDHDDLNLRVRLRDNRLTLVQPASVQMCGGRIFVDQLSIQNIRAPLRDMQAALRLENLALLPLTQRARIFPFFGELSGTLSDLRIQNGEMSAVGELQASVFQGEVALSRLHGRRMDQISRQIGFDARFQRLNLGLLSSITGFGYINGVLDGTVNGIEIQGGRTIAFDADIYTLPRSAVPDVDYQVGIRAVRNIAIFSGASEALKFLDEGIYSFIDTYNYDGLGFQAHLSNDRLRLKAKLSDGERQLLLKGRGLPRIDVVYHENGGEVAFESLMRQMKEVNLRLKKDKAS